MGLEMTQQKRILVVEDEPEAGAAMQRFLEFRGHKVNLARNARRALELAEETSLDVLVCDWQLEDQDDGVDVAREVQSSQDVPVVLVTGQQLSRARLKARQSQVRVAAFRRKPVSLSELANLIESLQ